MSDLIDRQAAIDALDEIESEVADGYGYQYEKWRKYFCELPSAQPERKKGKWIFIGNQMFECSECGTCYTQSQFHQMRVRISDPEFPKFCPNCGARMKI